MLFNDNGGYWILATKGKVGNLEGYGGGRQSRLYLDDGYFFSCIVFVLWRGGEDGFGVW